VNQIGALGDIHGDFASVRRIMRQHPEVQAWLCVGDVADAEGRYDAFDAPLHRIRQQRELRPDCVGRSAGEPSLHSNGTLRVIAGLRVAGLGGTFAPTI
jgi:hypothetical protein